MLHKAYGELWLYIYILSYKLLNRTAVPGTQRLFDWETSACMPQQGAKKEKPEVHCTKTRRKVQWLLI
jgi:hypothetical protein